jgi:hypothetical protein
VTVLAAVLALLAFLCVGAYVWGYIEERWRRRG